MGTFLWPVATPNSHVQWSSIQEMFVEQISVYYARNGYVRWLGEDKEHHLYLQDKF